jgi:putative transposase
MPRLARFTPAGIPQHVIQHGNNRQVTFCCDEDFAFYIYWLQHYSEKSDVEIHAWVLMTNHVHRLATPKLADGLSKMMQSLGRMYVRYFNKQYKRVGTLREGWFKLLIVKTENYLLRCYRYIELNPLRAGMVSGPAEYKWSSYQCNALGKQSDLLTPHDEYLILSKSRDKRQKIYRDLFKYQLDKELVTKINDATNKGMAIGSENFKQAIEMNFNRRMPRSKMGRPNKVMVSVKMTAKGWVKRLLCPICLFNRKDQYSNNRAEQLPEGTRVRERVMRKFTSVTHVNRFIGAHK